MISVNKVIGTFSNITTEQEILLPNAVKVVFVSDNARVMVSINDNEHYMEYKNADGVIEFVSDHSNGLYINKIYVKSISESNINIPASLRIWVLTEYRQIGYM
jgi:hypothetical protein